MGEACLLGYVVGPHRLFFFLCCLLTLLQLAADRPHRAVVGPSVHLATRLYVFLAALISARHVKSRAFVVAHLSKSRAPACSFVCLFVHTVCSSCFYPRTGFNAVDAAIASSTSCLMNE